MEIPQEKQFHFKDGSQIADLQGLKEKIESISYDEFYEHVNAEKNDFANWVEHVLEEPELAERLKAVGSIVETVELLNEALYPEETKQAEEALGDEDFQARIEEQLFSEPEQSDEPAAAPPAEAPESGQSVTPSSEEPVQPPKEPLPEPTAISPVDELASAPEREPISKEELAGSPEPRESVTTNEPGHTPVTEMVSKPTHDEHFPVKQFLMGIILGLIAGFLLAKMTGLA